jgi:hypothetical protein
MQVKWKWCNGLSSDAPPNSLKNLDASLKMKITKEKGIGVCSLVCSTLKGERAMLKLWDGD